MTANKWDVIEEFLYRARAPLGLQSLAHLIGDMVNELTPEDRTRWFRYVSAWEGRMQWVPRERLVHLVGPRIYELMTDRSLCAACLYADYDCARCRFGSVAGPCEVMGSLFWEFERQYSVWYHAERHADPESLFVRPGGR